MSSAYIIAGARTPQGKLLGSLAGLSAPQLASHTLKYLQAERAGVEIDQIILGNVVSAGVGQAPARQAATLAGLANTIGAVTVNKVCGSGLYSVMLADMAIRAGEYRAVLAGGMESMSRAPHLIVGSRTGYKYGTIPLVDALDSEGLVCAHHQQAMGVIAQQLANRCGIDRQAQDAWALRSHTRATAAQQAGSFTSEIIPVEVVLGKQTLPMDRDETPRADCSIASLQRLPAAFAKDGSVSAGNASSLADGAAAVMVIHESLRNEVPGAWAFRIVGHVNVAGAHADLFTAPALAVKELLKRTGRKLNEIDLLEINEAFAVQTLACLRDLAVDEEKVNVHGGAIALGHPLGASGARVLVTLIHALLQRQKTLGVATLCLGGGEAVALMIERA